MKPKQQPKPAPVEVPPPQPQPTPQPVDVMNREIPPEIIEVRYFIAKDIGDRLECQDIDVAEHNLSIDLVRVMRHGGWMKEFLWDLISQESMAIKYGKQPRFDAQTIKELVDCEVRQSAAA